MRARAIFSWRLARRVAAVRGGRRRADSGRCHDGTGERRGADAVPQAAGDGGSALRLVRWIHARHQRGRHTPIDRPRWHLQLMRRTIATTVRSRWNSLDRLVPGERPAGLDFLSRHGRSATLTYEFANKSRLGLRFSHISNGGLHRRNPGEQALLLTYATLFYIEALPHLAICDIPLPTHRVISHRRGASRPPYCELHFTRKRKEDRQKAYETLFSERDSAAIRR